MSDEIKPKTGRRLTSALAGPRRILLVAITALAVAVGGVAAFAAVSSKGADAYPTIAGEWNSPMPQWIVTSKYLSHKCSSGSGPRDYVDGYRHLAIDLSAEKKNPPVQAIDDGVVISVDSGGLTWDSKVDGKRVGPDLYAVYVRHKTASGQFFVAEYDGARVNLPRAAH